MDPVNNYFKIPPNNPSDGICLKCAGRVSRGAAGKKAKSYGTTCLADHLRRHHSVLYKEYLKQKAKYDAAKKSAINNTIYELNNGSGNPKAISSSQPTLASAFDCCIKYKPNDTKQTEFVYDLMESLADAKLPFVLVMNKKFRDLWRKHAPKYTVPSDKHLREAIFPDIHRRVHHAISQQVSKIEWFCGGTDLWTSQNGKAYMSLTIHFIDETWERKMLVLNCMPYDEDHTAPRLATALKSVLNTWGISSKLHSFARDSAPNVVLAMKTNNWDHFGCFLHILALIVGHAIGKNGQPAVRRMIKRVNRLNKVINDVSVKKCQDLKTRLINGLLNYFGGNDPRQCFPDVEKTKKFTLATLLDPRFKTKLFSSDTIRDSATAALAAYVAKRIEEEREQRQSTEASTPPCQQKNASFWSFDDAPTPEAPVTHKSSTTRAREMIHQYIAEPSIPFDGAYLQYWKTNESRWPQLAKVAKVWLCPPIRTVASERSFKVAKRFSNDERCRTLPSNVQKLLFVHYNLRALGYNSLTFPQPPALHVDATGPEEDEMEPMDWVPNVNDESGDDNDYEYDDIDDAVPESQFF